MRRWFAVLLLTGFASHAAAGEFETPVLRGSSPFIPAAPTYTRWHGFYAGGQIGYSSTQMNFANATESLIAYVLRTTALENEQHPSRWGVLGTAYPAGSNIGGFVGYNSQWDQAIVGFDIHYNRGSYAGVAPVSPIRRVTSANGNTYDVTIQGNASMNITDFGAARLRAGWVVNNILPYATAGLAFGRANVSRSAQVFGAENPPAGYPGYPAGPGICGPAAVPPSPTCTEFNFSASESKNQAWLYGWTAGGGADFMVMPRIFMRAEYEYTSFARIMGISARMHTARLGAGFKF